MVRPRRSGAAKPAKNTIWQWFTVGSEAAARFLTATILESVLTAVHRVPGDFPSGMKGYVLTVVFAALGVRCLGLIGGPALRHTAAVSFRVATTDRAEPDRHRGAIVGHGGRESACGWCEDKWRPSGPITPAAPTDATAEPAATRAF